VLQSIGCTVVTSPLWTATQQVAQAILLLTRDHRTLLSAPSLLTDQVAELLSRMALAGEVAGDGGVVRVSVPPTRSDVLHACDVAEVRSRAFLLPRAGFVLLADGVHRKEVLTIADVATPQLVHL
jgi:phenylalanyl-tRNA synthetase beta subunit